MNALRVLGGRVRAGYLWLEDKPLVVVLVAAGATVAVAFVLASVLWPAARVATRTVAPQLAVAPRLLVGELVAYGGYVLTVRDMARVDDGNEVDLEVRQRRSSQASAYLPPPVHQAVLPSTTGPSGKPVVRRDAVRRVVGLGLLEYVVLSIAALGASALLFSVSTGTQATA